MPKDYWPLSLSLVCIFWGTAILFAQHHLSTLIPVLGIYLLCYGLALAVVLFVRGRKS